MQQRRNQRSIRDMTIMGGWLFADLLLALVVILLATQPPFPKLVKPTITPTPTFTPTPTPEPRLELVYHHITLNNVDYQGILNNSSSAVNNVEQQINGHTELRGRSAGLVVVYDGAPSDADIGQAQDVARAVVKNVLQVMGQHGPLFQRSSYYGPLYFLGVDHNTVILDVYLFR